MQKKDKINYQISLNKNNFKKRRLRYRELRIMGWVFMACLVLGTIFTNGVILDLTGQMDSMVISGPILSSLGMLALPAFFVANFSIIIMGRSNYKSLFRKYFIFIGLILIFLFGFLYRYFILIICKQNGGNIAAACDTLTKFLNANPTFGTCFNLFVDLLLMLACWYFIEYTPRKHFQGKNLKYFRLLAIIPILYELSFVSLKIVTMVQPHFNIPFYVYPFMTCKPPILFFSFVAIAIREKLQERKYLALLGNNDKYQEYLKSNAASKSFSKFTAIVFLIAAIIDIIIYFVTVRAIVNNPTLSDIDSFKALTRLGVGKGVSLVLMIPIILFYSYNKRYKETKTDILIPIIGVVVFSIIIIEAIIDTILG